MKLSSLRSRPLPSSVFRFPKSGKNRKLASESDGEELMAIGFISGLRGLARERRLLACNYLLYHEYAVFDHGTNFAPIILENQGGGKCNL